MIPDYSDVGGFMLKNAGRSERILSDIQLTRHFGRKVLRADLSTQPRDVFYWVLPKLFIGNRLTSYGGSLRYTIQFNQGENARVISSADVKITGHGFTLEYRGDSQPTPANPTSYNVKFTEVTVLVRLRITWYYLNMFCTIGSMGFSQWCSSKERLFHGCVGKSGRNTHTSNLRN